MTTSKKIIRSGLRAARLALALSAAALSMQPALAQEKPAASAPASTTPPDPPVKPDQPITPMSYRSYTTDLVSGADHGKYAKDPKGTREGTMKYREWWYSYEDIDFVYVVGVAEVTVTPAGSSLGLDNTLPSMDISLHHTIRGCKAGEVKPESNHPGYPVSVAVNVTPDGVEVGGSAGTTVMSDTVGIAVTEKTDDWVTWHISTDWGSHVRKSGFNKLILSAEWTCPKSTVPTNEVGWGSGNIEIGDSLIRNTVIGWNCKGELDGDPVEGSIINGWYYSKNFGWVEEHPTSVPGQFEPQRPTSAKADSDKVLKTARARAIAGMRSGGAENSGTMVALAFGNNTDPSAQARYDAGQRMAEAEQLRQRGVQVSGASTPANNEALLMVDEPAPAIQPNNQAMTVDQPASKAPSNEALMMIDEPASARTAGSPTVTMPNVSMTGQTINIAGSWYLQDTSKGINCVIFRKVGNSYVLSGFGPDIALQQAGDSYLGNGQTGQVRVTPQGGQLMFTTTSSNGGGFSTTLHR